MSIGPNIALAPDTVKAVVRAEPAQNILTSMLVLNNVPFRSGFSSWVEQTATLLSSEQQTTNQLLFWGLGLDTLLQLFPPTREWADLPAFLDDLASVNAIALRDAALNYYSQPSAMLAREFPHLDSTEPELFIQDRDAFLNYMYALYEQKSREGFGAAPTFFERLFDLLHDPDELKALIITHLQDMWDSYLFSEWESVRPKVDQAVRAFDRVNISALSAHEAMRVVTGRDLREIIPQADIENIETIIFVPSPHSGPYVLWSIRPPVMHLIFGLRLPVETEQGKSILGRDELLMVLDALDDETRLDILALIREHGEMGAPEIMDHFNLSQSAASRHLRQMSATSLITERRCNGAKKCYSFNADRIREVQQTLDRLFLDE